MFKKRKKKNVLLYSDPSWRPTRRIRSRIQSPKNSIPPAKKQDPYPNRTYTFKLKLIYDEKTFFCFLHGRPQSIFSFFSAKQQCDLFTTAISISANYSQNKMPVILFKAVWCLRLHLRHRDYAIYANINII